MESKESNMIFELKEEIRKKTHSTCNIQLKRKYFFSKKYFDIEVMIFNDPKGFFKPNVKSIEEIERDIKKILKRKKIKNYYIHFDIV